MNEGERASVAYTPIERFCIYCNQPLYSGRAAHWECEIKNRATASGGSDNHQNPGAAPHYEVGMHEVPAIGRRDVRFWFECTCGFDSGTFDDRRLAQAAAFRHEQRHVVLVDFPPLTPPPYYIEEEP